MYYINDNITTKWRSQLLEKVEANKPWVGGKAENRENSKFSKIKIKLWSKFTGRTYVRCVCQRAPCVQLQCQGQTLSPQDAGNTNSSGDWGTSPPQIIRAVNNTIKQTSIHQTRTVSLQIAIVHRESKTPMISFVHRPNCVKCWQHFWSFNCGLSTHFATNF